MTENTDQEVVILGIRLLDDAYMAWFVAESDCECALRASFETATWRPEAHFTYRAALDREEAAAQDLKRLVRLTKPHHETIAARAEEMMSDRPNDRRYASARACGHWTHVGTCPACQRFQLERRRSQLRDAGAVRDWAERVRDRRSALTAR